MNRREGYHRALFRSPKRATGKTIVHPTMSIRFEWDATKAAANARKHEVTFEEAATVFANPLAVIFDDEAH
jgi:hypothetical protein